MQRPLSCPRAEEWRRLSRVDLARWHSAYTLRFAPLFDVMIATNPWFWIGFNAFVLGMLALDLGVFHKKAHVVSPKEAGIWTAVWVSLALLFAGGLWAFAGTHAALTFLTGYVIEEALSVDNIFVIVLIFAYFNIPLKYQH